jgi:CHAD domain-containing protein
LAFQFKRGEPVPRAIRRVVTEQLESSAGRLRNAAASTRDEAVHEARKSIKKVRAVIRLMSDELGRVAGARNDLLSDLARKVAALRDAAVLVETVDSLSAHLPGEIDSRLIPQLRTRLVRDRTRITRELAPAQLLVIAFALEQVAGRVRDWPLHTAGFAALASGLNRTLHRGRKALARVKQNPTVETFHQWRKRVKDHWYHVRLLGGIWTGDTRSYERNLKELETCLGDDHNLAMLRERIAALADTPEGSALLAAVDNRQKHLRDRALHLGERLYAPKPREFVRHAEELWDAWQPVSRKSSPMLQRRPKKTPASAA